MRLTKLLALSLVAAAVPACTSMNMNFNEETKFGDPEIIDWHAAITSIDEWDGNLIDADFLGMGREGTRRKGELAYVGLWPIGGVGVGPVGAYVKILPVELGLSLFLYDVDGSQGTE